MTARRALRIAIVGAWLMFITAQVLSYLLRNSLPAQLQVYLAAEDERETTLLGVAALLIGVPCLAASVVSSIGIFFFARWARWLYLGSMAVSYAAAPLYGPTVEHVVADTFDHAETLLSGVVLGIAFFTDAIPREDAPRKEQPPSNPRTDGSEPALEPESSASA